MRQSFTPSLRICMWMASFFCFLTQASAQHVLPSGFAETRLAQNLNPTGMAIAPDGRVFLLQKNGQVRIVKDDVLLTTPFVTLTNIDDFNERGLLGIAFEPNFAQNGYVYLYYTHIEANNARRNRIVRVTASGDVAVAGSQVTIFDTDVLTSAGNHNGGAMQFGADGKLYIATGENATASNSQSFNNVLGKILRINADGTIPTDNPYYNTATGNNRAIYALGLRNPFSLAIQNGTGRIFANDVGGSAAEEVNDILAGKNYGWPAIEGFRSSQTPPANYQDPLYAYGRSQGCSIIGAAFYNPQTNTFPSNYVGKFFFGDYCNGYIKVLNPANGQVESTFMTGINRPVDMEVGPNGALYYLERAGQGGGSTGDNTSSNNGSLWKVVYTASLAPSIAQQPNNQTVAEGGTASFTVAASGQAPLSYQWQKNGTNVTGANQTTLTLTNVPLTDNNARYRCVVTNASGSATSNEATLTVLADRPPVATISTPAEGLTYRAGDVLSFSGTGTDNEDGNLPASAFTWWIDFHHADHTHPALDATTGITSGTYEIPKIGEISDTVWYRVYLRVTDSKGLTNTVFRDVFPQKVTLRIESEPVATTLNLDGALITPPRDVISVIGVTRQLNAPASFTSGGQTYNFKQWSNGSTNRLLTFDTPPQNTTYRAIFESATPPVGTGTGLTGRYYNNGNRAFTVPVTLTRTDPTINFNWGSGSPAASIANDNYTIRWTGQILAPRSEEFTFFTTTDDGVRLWVNGTLIIDKWIDQAAREWSGRITLVQGQRYDIRLEYYERGGQAVSRLSWSSPSITKQIIPAAQLFPETAPQGLTAHYFTNATSFPATPTLTRTDAAVDFDWSGGSPDPSIGSDNFMARWTGKVLPQFSEEYTFFTTSDDGIRLWVNNQLIIDRWFDQGATEWNGKITLTAGQPADIRLEYYERGGLAVARLAWSSPSVPKQIIPAARLSPNGGQAAQSAVAQSRSTTGSRTSPEETRLQLSSGESAGPSGAANHAPVGAGRKRN
ncbi:MAG: PA14 domain-containing protein [Cytophagales bacterium]|nr:PA14 domain-containing protein [Cytophagales bacterium]